MRSGSRTWTTKRRKGLAPSSYKHGLPVTPRRMGSALDCAVRAVDTPRVCLASTFYASGGAAIAAARLHGILERQGYDATMLVKKLGGSPQKVYVECPPVSPFVRKLVPALTSRFLSRIQYPNHSLFSINWQPLRSRRFSVPKSSELLHVHWVTDGFLTPELWEWLDLPVVMTMHDMWAFTGGCHYTSGCQQFTSGCRSCPQLHAPWEHFLARWTWNRKRRGYEKVKPMVISPSRWLADQAGQSELLKDCEIRVIPNVIDLDVFRPSNSLRARKRLNLPLGKKLLLFGAQNPTSDPRKGFSFLHESLMRIKQSGALQDLELVVFGSDRAPEGWPMPFPTHWMGTLDSDHDLAKLYVASDLFVTPSTQENLPNTIVEASACGIPVVAFKVGGIPEMIVHKYSGFLAEPNSSTHLAEGILYCMDRPAAEMGSVARRIAESRYGQSAVDAHIELYRECVVNNCRSSRTKPPQA